MIPAAVGTFGGALVWGDSRGNAYTIDGRESAKNLFACCAIRGSALQPGTRFALTYPSYSGVSQAIASEFAGIARVE